MSDRIRFSNKFSLISANGKSNVTVSDGPAGDESALPDLQADETTAKLQEAYQQGWNECQQQMSGQIEQLNSQLRAVSQELPASLSGYFAELENQVREETANLALAIAGKILKNEIAREENLRGIIKDALSPVTDFRNVKLHLNPAVATDAAGTEAVPAGIEVISDPQLAAGEAVVESSQGFIDATLNGRLEAVAVSIDELLAEMKEDDA